MSMIDLGAKKVFKFKWDGEEYELNYPRMKDLKLLPEEGMDGKEAIDFTMDFLQNLGAPKSVLEDMDYDVVVSLQKHITEHLAEKK